MSLRVGVSIGRRSGTVLGVEWRRGAAKITLEHRVPRPVGQPVHETFAYLLGKLPPTLSKAPIVLALSPSDLACADAWLARQKVSVARAGSVLCEARAAGETLESLAVEVLECGPSLRAVAISSALLAQIRTVARSHNLAVVTAMPAPLAETFGESALTSGGERIEIRPQGGTAAKRPE